MSKELEINAAALLQQKEAKVKLEKSIDGLSQTEKDLDGKIKLKETNLEDLTNKVEEKTKELDKKAATLKSQQDMVEKVVKEKNESIESNTKKIEADNAAIDKQKEELETREQKLNNVNASIESKQKEIDLKEFEVEQKEKSIELQIETLTKKEKEVKGTLGAIEKEKKANIAAIEKVRKETEKQKKISQASEETTIANQEAYKKANKEKIQNQEILSSIVNAETQLRIVTELMRQEFDRLIWIAGTDMKFLSQITPEHKEAVGRALLGNVYQDPKKLKDILNSLEGIEVKLEDSEKEELLEKITELQGKIATDSWDDQIIQTQADELKNLQEKCELDINAVIEAKDKEIEALKNNGWDEVEKLKEDNKELKATSDKTLQEFKAEIIKANDLENKNKSLEEKIKALEEVKTEKVEETKEVEETKKVKETIEDSKNWVAQNSTEENSK